LKAEDRFVSLPTIRRLLPLWLLAKATTAAGGAELGAPELAPAPEVQDLEVVAAA